VSRTSLGHVCFLRDGAVTVVHQCPSFPSAVAAGGP
jgi:hypothetical protein